jgi:hypothetical protein
MKKQHFISIIVILVAGLALGIYFPVKPKKELSEYRNFLQPRYSPHPIR